MGVGARAGCKKALVGNWLGSGEESCAEEPGVALTLRLVQDGSPLVGTDTERMPVEAGAGEDAARFPGESEDEERLCGWFALSFLGTIYRHRARQRCLEDNLFGSKPSLPAQPL